MATSRLKRKLDQADDGRYGNLTESFVSVGTALPSLADHKKDTNEFVPPWEQKVFDEQGRRRFHGAFTGGFSAGYYNSAGSKEGEMDAVDLQFMDDEDLAELASARTLETSSAYASSSRPPQAQPSASTYDPLLGNFGPLLGASSAAPGAAAPSSSAFDDTLASLIQPASSRVGLKLMRKMGWREGQGVGPRVTHRQRQKQAAELGVRLDADEGDDDELDKHYYAPLDRPLTLVKGTSASMDKGWGLGYQPSASLDQRLKQDGAAYSSSARAPAYELDEEDVYGGSGMGVGAMGERQKRAIGIYDEDDDGDSFGSMRSSRDKRREQPKRSVAAKESFFDGTQVLPGFKLHREPVAGPSQSHVPPPPPPGWRPDPSRLWKENQSPPGAHDIKGKGRQLDADERGSLLGERQPAPPPDLPKSVFDYLSAKSRERLASLTSAPGGGPPSSGANASASSTTAPSMPEPDEALFVPPLDRPTAQAALRGFQPYSAASTSPDPVKQARYTLYLQYQASGEATSTSSPFGPRTVPSSGRQQTVAELNRELSEYAQSARVFKPVGGMLGSRFQSSVSASLDMPKVEPGLYQPPPKAAKTGNAVKDVYGDASSSSTNDPPRLPEPELTPAQQAARAGNFGPGTTRTTRPFRPAKLLCKRFGVRDPNENASGVESDGVGGAWGEATAMGWGGAGTGSAQGAAQPVGEGALDEMMRSAGFKRFQAAAQEEASVGEDAPEVAKGAFETRSAGGGEAGTSRRKVPPTIETVGYGDDEEQGKEILEEKRAPQDIFAAIFADSDDDDDGDDDNDNDNDDDDDEPAPAVVLSVDPVHPAAASTTSADPFAPAPAPAPVPAARAHDEPPIPLSLDTLTSYKPAFVPTSSRTSSDKKDEADKERDKKKRDKKRRATVGLSFDLDEGGEDDAAAAAKKKPRREKDRGREKEKGEDRRPKRDETEHRPARIVEDDEWAEAPSRVHPDVLAAVGGPAASTRRDEPAVQRDEAPAQGRSGRMKAADLY
ncbi:uncharacterized protein RHOBADRAFT_50524 [Rhodotorula graminis WP1]|uniref:G-patch domain-containing protein n=1 Tax=Rhodotorula graminis (strain WP1) TaxID=578459 RepID=A0A194SER5_RHOGW|nr:uncharacterized protein RHOBADRAFT_50524 [Rhodotorula graminis WP1]KPV78001.1 hypothetical protein RHOBADRAFT_50524 [Rhodotorula graminis WP1]